MCGYCWFFSGLAEAMTYRKLPMWGYGIVSSPLIATWVVDAVYAHRRRVIAATMIAMDEPMKPRTFASKCFLTLNIAAPAFNHVRAPMRSLSVRSEAVSSQVVILALSITTETAAMDAKLTV